jgi:DNA modification methylase
MNCSLPSVTPARIRKSGFTNPVLVDRDNKILAGNGRFAAAKLLGLASIPTIRLEHLTNEQKRTYALADNKIALNAGWDLDVLAADLKELAAIDLSFDLEITGFETAEIDLLIDGEPTADPADEALEVAAHPVSRTGDHWLLGEHRLLCGDSLRGRSYAELMGSEKARTVFADVPFNVPILGHVGGLGSIKHREFAMASGEMSEAEFIKFLHNSFAHMASVSVDGAIHFICMDWRHISEVLAASRGVYAEYKNLCVWAKDNGGMGSLYRSQHELIFVFKVGTAPHINTIELGRNGRYRTNVWQYAGVNTMRRGRQEELEMHPTVKPIALVVDAIKDCSHRGDIVLDPFCGSGTTIIAAEKSGRRARAIEIDPLYVDVAIRRWQKFTKKQVVMDVTGETFEEIAVQRLGQTMKHADVAGEQEGSCHVR